MNKQTKSKLFGITLHFILGACFVFLMCSCAKESLRDLEIDASDITAKEQTFRDQILAKLQATPYWTPELAEVHIYSTTSDNRKALCGAHNSGGCTDLVGVVLEREHPAFCRVLVHELMHVSQHYQRGDADQGHGNNYLFNQFPDTFCGQGLTNPFFAKSPFDCDKAFAGVGMTCF